MIISNVIHEFKNHGRELGEIRDFFLSFVTSSLYLLEMKMIRLLEKREEKGDKS